MRAIILTFQWKFSKNEPFRLIFALCFGKIFIFLRLTASLLLHANQWLT